jgi:hypothetical protein
MWASRFSTSTGACLRIAAPVLEVGRLLASPSAKTLGKRTVLQAVLVDLDPASGVGERAALDEVGGAHRRRDVQEVVVHHHLLGRAARLGPGEHGLAVLRSDRDQVVVEAGDHAALADQAVEHVAVLLHREHLGPGGGEHDLDGVADPARRR